MAVFLSSEVNGGDAPLTLDQQRSIGKLPGLQAREIKTEIWTVNFLLSSCLANTKRADLSFGLGEPYFEVVKQWSETCEAKPWGLLRNEPSQSRGWDLSAACAVRCGSFFHDFNRNPIQLTLISVDTYCIYIHDNITTTIVLTLSISHGVCLSISNSWSSSLILSHTMSPSLCPSIHPFILPSSSVCVCQHPFVYHCRIGIPTSWVELYHC